MLRTKSLCPGASEATWVSSQPPGKQSRNLPAYTNAWLGPQPGQDRPGQYPSGGPTARMHGVWRAAAPALDFLAPDIYIPGAKSVMAQYAAGANPLFVPEARFATGNAFLAIGEFRDSGRSISSVRVRLRMVSDLTVVLVERRTAARRRLIQTVVEAQFVVGAP